MVIIVNQSNRAQEHVALRSMFEARKQVFVDMLKWDVPVLAGRFEVDQFDDGAATYLIVTDNQRRHLASARLLATTRPALLDSLYPELCEGAVPRGRDIIEITRFCLSPGIGARRRREARDRLLIGLVEFARANAVRIYTGVAEWDWFCQIRTFGWACRALGAPRECDGRLLTALRIEIDDQTLACLADAGIVAEPVFAMHPARAA